MKVSTRERRFLVIGGAAAVAFLLIWFVVEPFVSSQMKIGEEIRQQQAILERYQLLAGERERYQRKVEQLRGQLDQAQTLLLKKETLSLVAADLQGLLHRLGQEANVTIVRENVLPPKKGDVLNQVTVELSMKGELVALRDFLHKIGTVPKLLTIPKLTIRAAHVRGSTVPLSLDLQVAGYSAAEEKG